MKTREKVFVNIVKNPFSMNVKIKCDECDKHYSNKDSLLRHVRAIHKGLKWNCDSCEKTFTQQGNLKVHVDSYHRLQKHQCEHCGKYFNAKYKQNFTVEQICYFLRWCNARRHFLLQIKSN